MFAPLFAILLASVAVSAGTTVEPYGYIKLDAAWDDSRVYSGNGPVWVEAEETNKNDSQFNMTANETRLGLRVTGPEFGKMKTRGVVEGDFYGGGPANKSNPMMRHAYGEVSWPAWDFAVLGGQTWDVMGPLNPPTLNYIVLWGAGNIAYRRPQLRMTKGIEVGETRVELAAAAVRTISQTSTVYANDNGADAGFPTGEARLGVSIPSWNGQKIVVGLGGHIGQEEWDDPAKAGNPVYFRSWSAIVDLSVPVCETLSLKGEGWTGENLYSYNASIYQGIAGIGLGTPLAKWETIRAKGGWVALSAGPYKFWKFNAGTGLDDPYEADLKSGSDKKRNQSVFLSVTYDITPATTLGLEVSDWITEYKASAKNAEALRVQTSLIHRF